MLNTLNYNVRGENIEVTPAIRDYVETKVGKIEKYFDEQPFGNVQANLKVYSDKNAKVEVTIILPYITLRAEETSPDLYGSIDLVSDKLERQIRKYKTKVNRKFRHQKADIKEVVPQELLDKTTPEKEDDSDRLKIVRKKRFNLKPMNAEEAALQMEMIGHSFFVYFDSETESTNIVYKRDDGDYGLIETDENRAEI